MMVVLAHTGVGKTRLAQELYRWLSTHPRWDATNFWPDDLGLDQQSLKVNPELPPELDAQPAFVWWGVRATSTIDRNASEVACIVEHCSRLRHLRKLLDPLLGAGELGRAALDVVSDLAIPVPGLKTFFGLAQSVHDRLHQRKLGSAETEGREQRDLADELLEHLQVIMKARRLPTVLLLDDMQWIDAESLDFVRRLWERSCQQRWPLLIVATHWESAWRHSLRLPEKERSAFFARFSGSEGVESIVLSESPPTALAGWAREALPGLPPRQVDLLVEKAGRNFLQMVQNVAALRTKSATHFEGGTLTGSLNARGERYVGSFETDPGRRAHQMFEELEQSVQVVLGWASTYGLRFLGEVVVELAERSGQLQGASGYRALEDAIDPHALLAQTTEHLSEFRQGVFHSEARRQFELLDIKPQEIDEALRAVVAEWIENSFDENGEPHPFHGTPDEPPRARAAVSLPPEELRDLLSWALKLFPPVPSAAFDSSNPVHRLSARCSALALLLECREGRYHAVRQHAQQRIAPSMPAGAPLSLLGADAQDALAYALAFACEPRLAAAWRRSQLESLETAIPEEYRTRWRLSVQQELADALSTLGQLAESLQLYRNCVELARQLASAADEEQRRADQTTLASQLRRLAKAEWSSGRLREAEALQLESLSLLRELITEKSTRETRWELACVLALAGWSEQARGDLDSALAKYEESLAIARGLAEELGTLDSHRSLTLVLGGLADTLREFGNLTQALELATESANEARKVLRQVESDEDCNPFVWMTCVAAGISMELGRVAEAAALLESARGTCASLERTEQEAVAILDTAATFHERLADLARVCGDAAGERAEREKAAAIRARIGGE